LNTVVRGINFSVRDENLHSLGGAWAFRTLLAEREAKGWSRRVQVSIKLAEVGRKIVEHEDEIINMIFSEGEVSGITAAELKAFVRHRVDFCLENLGLEPLFKVTWNPIADWFYKNINMVQFSDFFVGVGNQYNSKHVKEKFGWRLPDVVV
jgi:ribonucleoside-diphosphate reductase beta chain